MGTQWNMAVYENDIRRALRAQYKAVIGVATPDCDINNFPRAVINVECGIVVKQIQLLDNPNCSLPDMEGWAVEDLLEWLTESTTPAPLHMIAWEL